MPTLSTVLERFPRVRRLAAAEAVQCSCFFRRRGRWRNGTVRSTGSGILKHGTGERSDAREYCLANGLSVESLRRWRRRAQKGLDAKSPLTLVAAWSELSRFRKASCACTVRAAGGSSCQSGGGSLADWLRQLP